MDNNGLGITNMNGVTSDEDVSCGLNDMNCVGDEGASQASITNMNGVTSDEDVSCGLNDMNCTGQ